MFDLIGIFPGLPDEFGCSSIFLRGLQSGFLLGRLDVKCDESALTSRQFHTLPFSERHRRVATLSPLCRDPQTSRQEMRSDDA